MGAYLSEPKTIKESTDYEGVRVRCGASSMQGWRLSQEDAHNCILDFDKNTSLFAVYDGHGGHEVAEYCSKNLPNFIKQTENYIKGDYEQALKDAFLGFDETLITPEVIAELKTMANGKEGVKSGSDPGEDLSSEEEETIDHLVEEADMPLDEVMAKYKAARLLLSSGEGKPPASPMLRGRRSCAGDRPSSSSCMTQGDCAEVSSSSSSHMVAERILCNGEVHINGEGASKPETEVEVVSSGVNEKSEPDKSDTVKCGDEQIGRTEPDSSGLSNGESHNVSSSSENGDAAVEGVSSSSPPKKKRIPSADLYHKLLQEDSDSEEDETFMADAADSEDGSSDVADDTENKEAADEEEDSSMDDEEDEEDDTEYPAMDTKEEPGSDSGCTAVIAVLVGSDLFVANAGDSRCVVCRGGTALDMSFDHKPEDEPEKERIETAGGTVFGDGRVNGGLNLSRAIGDHSYKQVKHLPADKQMITALPDVKRITIEAGKDEFMVLACDGIWNSMSSQEVVDFVRSSTQQQDTVKLSQICEKLFDRCLAPNTQGDGTGCDNMTCVIVQFKPETSQDKRPAEEAADEPSAKKSKMEELTQTS